MNISKTMLFYDNKQRIENAWKLIEIARNLLNDVVDETDSNIDEGHEIVKLLYKADEDLYELYDLNKTLHYED